MRNYKGLVLIVAAIMLFSFAAVPPANAFIGMAALSAVLAAAFVSAVVVNETVVKSNNESEPEHSSSIKKTQDNLQAVYEP